MHGFELFGNIFAPRY